jgi:hypothetical protein
MPVTNTNDVQLMHYRVLLVGLGRSLLRKILFFFPLLYKRFCAFRGYSTCYPHIRLGLNGPIDDR